MADRLACRVQYTRDFFVETAPAMLHAPAAGWGGAKAAAPHSVLADHSVVYRTAMLTGADWAKALALADKPGANVSAIAAAFGIPRTTLISRLASGATAPTADVIGRPTTLTAEQEDAIAEHVQFMCDAGFGFTQVQLGDWARQIAADTELSGRLGGPDWVRGFLLRHPKLVRRTPKKRNGDRASKFNRIIVTKWMTIAGSLISQYTKSQILNADDKFFNLECLMPGKVRR
jgi:hypothetical protein